MKGKYYALIIAVLAFISIVAIFIFMQTKERIIIPSTILSSQQVQAIASGPLDEKSVENGWIQITDEKGNHIENDISIKEPNLLLLGKFSAGKYKVHIDKKAFKKSSFMQKDVVTTFSVMDALEPIKFDQQLVQHYENILAMEKNAQKKLGVKNDFVVSGGEEEKAAEDASDYSTTNNQVEGIEEADVAVTDGKVIYTATDRSVVLIDAADPKNLNKLSTIKFKENEYVQKLVLHEKLLIVVFERYGEFLENGLYRYENSAQVNIYNVENPNSPELVHSHGHEGMLVAVRKIEDMFYLITKFTPDYYRIEDLEPGQLKPAIYDGDSKEDSVRITILPNSTEPNMVTISAIDLKTNRVNSVETETYVGSAEGLYMSHEAIYLTAGKYDYNMFGRDMMVIDMIMEPVETTIYKFNVDGQSLQFAGQTTLEGRILNQFSMDEYKGYLRVASTKGNARGQNANSENSIIIYDGSLNKVGEISGLAKGERIYSARFMEDKAYVVTFKETDPLFTFDLSNPKAPKLLGELKIPGFSTYLHPIGENHLLGLGYDTKLVTEVQGTEPFIRRLGLKLSLFDVTDISNPIEQDVEYIGKEGTYSLAIDDHHAFFIHKDNSLYGFPVTLYDYSNPAAPFLGDGAMIFKVTEENGIEHEASLFPEYQGQSEEYWIYSTKRILYIGNALYAVKERGVTSYDINTYQQLDSVSLQ